ncbi:MAG: hypothetical protein ACK55I_03015, partial [bacterium]
MRYTRAAVDGIELDARLDEVVRRCSAARALLLGGAFDLDADRTHEPAVALGAHQDLHHARKGGLHVDGHGHRVQRPV